MKRSTAAIAAITAILWSANSGTANAQSGNGDTAARALIDLDKALTQADGDFGPLIRERLPAGRIQDAWAKSPPGQAIHEVRYDASREIKLRLREGAHTVVALPTWERVRPGSIITGSKEAVTVQVLPSGGVGNRLVLIPGQPGYDGTITVMGDSGRIYAFYVVIENDRSKAVPDFVVYVDARQPLDWTPAPMERGSDDGRRRDYLRELPFAADRADYRFSMTGDPSIAPQFVLSDGVFTYLFYDDPDRMDLPAVNRVQDGIDRPVNTRMVGRVLVVESGVGEGLTLRAGQKTVCVRAGKGKS